MQCILREKLMVQATKLAVVSNIYRTESYRFVNAYFDWLQAAERDLSALRSPISILIQAEKASLTSILDGYLPDNIHARKSARKGQKAAAAQSLRALSREIYSKIQSIDHEFNQLSEKMCHAVAVLAGKEPDLYDNLQPDQSGVNTVWKLLVATPETVPMYNYFSAKLAPSDVNYLLMDIIQKIVGNKTDHSE